MNSQQIHINLKPLPWNCTSSHLTHRYQTKYPSKSTSNDPPHPQTSPKDRCFGSIRTDPASNKLGPAAEALVEGGRGATLQGLGVDNHLVPVVPGPSSVVGAA